MNSTFELSILGSNSALPSNGRNPSCQYLHFNNEHFLIDCGEGAQKTMGSLRVPRMKIGHIFISHLHGDHYFGLPGLINSYILQGRVEELVIHSPPGLEKMIKQVFALANAQCTYRIKFVDLDSDVSEIIYESDQLSVTAIPLKHRIPCFGFLFREKERRASLDREKLDEYNVPKEERKKVSEGADFVCVDGKIVPNNLFRLEPLKARAYFYCTDTLVMPELKAIISGVDVMYHEATFEHALLDKAVYSMHTTATQAAQLAKDCNVSYLLMGHFSSRYKSTDVLKHEARSIFKESHCVVEGKKYALYHKDDEFKLLITN